MITIELLTLATIAAIVLLVTLKGWPVIVGAVLIWGLIRWYQVYHPYCGWPRNPAGPINVPPTA